MIDTFKQVPYGGTAKARLQKVFLTHGDNRECPDVQSGEFTRCHNHLVEDAVTLCLSREESNILTGLLEAVLQGNHALIPDRPDLYENWKDQIYKVVEP